MTDSKQLNHNQLMTLMILFTISAFAKTSKFAGQNIWIIMGSSGLAGLVLLTVYYRLSKLNDFKNLADIFKASFGKYIGKLILIIYAGFFFFRMVSVGNFMTAMAQQTLMFGASPRLVVFLLLITIVITSYYGLNAIGRSSEILLILTLLCTVPFFYTIFTPRIFNMENLVPILAEGVPGIARDTARSFFLPYSELMVFLALFPFVAHKNNDSRKMLKRTYIALIVSMLIIVSIDMITVAVLGASLVATFEYPFYNAMQLAGGSTGVLQRLDTLAIMIMVFTHYFKLVIYFYVTLLTVQSISKRFTFKWVLFIVAFVTFFVAPLITANSTEMIYETLPFKILPPFTVVVPFIAYLISEVKHRKKKKSLPA